MAGSLIAWDAHGDLGGGAAERMSVSGWRRRGWAGCVGCGEGGIRSSDAEGSGGRVREMCHVVRVGWTSRVVCVNCGLRRGM